MNFQRVFNTILHMFHYQTRQNVVMRGGGGITYLKVNVAFLHICVLVEGPSVLGKEGERGTARGGGGKVNVTWQQNSTHGWLPRVMQHRVGGPVTKRTFFTRQTSWGCRKIANT